MNAVATSLRSTMDRHMQSEPSCQHLPVGAGDDVALTVEQAVALQKELLDGFSQLDFQEKLQEAYKQGRS
eukprot:1891858-Amphidinium_carterae.1